ncbi:hypothetical protein N185_16965 [Sinorhizobium sp. GW3]|nr:hypothetical protein N185_16965 [Sinorhizobium sp. GW3]
MKTDDLIGLLAHDAKVTMPLTKRLGLALLGALAFASFIFVAAIGVRPDIDDAVQTIRFLYKFLITICLALTAAHFLFAAGRPHVSLDNISGLLLSPALLAAAVIVELIVLPSDQWWASMIGRNALKCLTIVPLLSVGPLCLLLMALRQGAPRHPTIAGGLAGLASAGIAATFYAANCTDDSPLFVALWYPLAISIVVAVGALCGTKMLRW